MRRINPGWVLFGWAVFGLALWLGLGYLRYLDEVLLFCLVFVVGFSLQVWGYWKTLNYISDYHD